MNSLDQTLFLWLNLGEQARPWLVNMARGASIYLPHWMVVAALTVALVGQAEHRAQAWRVLTSMALASLGAYLLKRGLALPRPFALGLGTQWVPHSASASFPSSHASTAAAFALSACCLLAMRWSVRALLLGAGLAVGWSRIALGLHFPSDVLAAWLLGLLCTLLVQRLTAPAHRRWPWRRNRFGASGYRDF